MNARRTKQPADVAFDEAGPVPSVDFPFAEMDASEAEHDAAELARYRQELARNLLRWLAESGNKTPRQVGVRVLILAHILNAGSRKELATRLGVTRQRVHALLTGFRKELALLRGCGAL